MEVCAARAERAVDFGAFSECGEARRRAVPGALNADGFASASAGLCADAYGDIAICAAIARRVDPVWAGVAERESAGICDNHAAVSSRRSAELWQRIPAGHLPGDEDRDRRPALQRQRSAQSSIEHA